MKKYIFIVLAALTAYACIDRDYESAFQEYVGINAADVTLKNHAIAESDTIAIPIIFGGEATVPDGVTVAYTVTGGALGDNYNIDNGLQASGNFSLPAGKLGAAYFVIRPTKDFEFEEDFDLTVTITGTSREGARLGYPYSTSYTFTVKDDDCLFEYEGENTGTEANFDGIDLVEDSDVTFTLVSGTDWTLDGLGQTMISDFWGETVTDSEPTAITIAPDGTITIAPQYVFTTLYNGNPYEYSIRGSGKVDNCGGKITISYEIFYSNEDGGIADFGGSISKWAADAGYTSSDVFEAELSPVE